MNFNGFLENLSNPEKTRNFNIFQNYTLDRFESCVKSLGLHRKFSQTNSPLRISVVGTNGKGSVSHILSRLAIESRVSKKCGLYTSPHLLHKEERICLNGKNISEERLNFLFRSLLEKHEKFLSELSYFELFTVLALYFFQEENCDFEIYEAGLGGRLDATKIAFSEIVVVTKIGLDHSEILGQTMEGILKEKLAISTEYTQKLFCYDQGEIYLNEIIFEYCKNNNIQLYFFSEKFINTDYIIYNRRFCEFIFKSIFHHFDLSHLESLKIEIPGRMEILRDQPKIIFDVAHNVSALEYLIKSIQLKYSDQKFNILFSCLKDKDVDGMLEILSDNEAIDQIYYYTAPEYSEISSKNLEIEIVDRSGIKNLFKNSERTLLIAGSFRLYSLVTELLVEMRK